MIDRRRGTWVLLGALAVLPALAPSPQILVKPKVGEIKRLADERAKLAERMLDYYRESLKAPPAPGDPIQNPAARYAAGYEPIRVWSRHLLDARLDGAANAEGRIRILATEIERIEKFEKGIQEMAKNNPEWRVVADGVAFNRLEIESRLAKEKEDR